MKAGRGSAVLLQLIVLYMPSHILFFSHKRGGGGIIFGKVMAKQGHKISFLKILNYTSPPPLINYDQSFNVFFMHSASAVDIYRAQRKHINYSI